MRNYKDYLMFFSYVVVAVVVIWAGFETLHLSSEYDYSQECPKVKVSGTIDVDFLLSQMYNFSVTSDFCQTKGYKQGVTSSTAHGLYIYCQDSGRYEYFPVMKDFARYIYEKQIEELRE